MRRRLPVSRSRVRLALLALAALGLGARSTIACSSESDAASAQGDAGERTGDRAPPAAADAEPPCDPDADLTANVKDAAIADGATSTGVCVACAKARCADAIAACAANCQCQRIVEGAIECYLTTRQLGCVQDLADYLVTNETRRQALQILGCVQSECPVECATDGGEPLDAGD